MNFIEWKALLESEDDRSHAADQLPDDGDDEEVVRLLSVALNDSDQLVRACAAHSLGNCHLDSARQALRTALTRETDEVAISYILVSLALVGEVQDIERILPYVNLQQPSRTRHSAREALVHLALDCAAYPMLREYSADFDAGGPTNGAPVVRVVEAAREYVEHAHAEANKLRPFEKHAADAEILDKIIGAARDVKTSEA